MGHRELLRENVGSFLSATLAGSVCWSFYNEDGSALGPRFLEIPSSQTLSFEIQIDQLHARGGCWLFDIGM